MSVFIDVRCLRDKIFICYFTEHVNYCLSPVYWVYGSEGVHEISRLRYENVDSQVSELSGMRVFWGFFRGENCVFVICVNPVKFFVYNGGISLWFMHLG